MSNHFTENRMLLPTPKFIKILIIFNLVFGCLSGFFHSLLGDHLRLSFIQLFGLSFKGLLSGFIWQPLTFMFLPEIQGGLSFYFLFTLCFDIYLLWLIGSQVHSHLGQKTTLKLFFITALGASFTTLISHHFFQSSTPLFGLSFSMIPLIVAHCFLNPQTRFYFIPNRPLQLKWLGVGLVVLYLFRDIADLQGLAFSTHLFLFISTYFYMVLFQKKKSPFEFTHKLDQFFISRKNKTESSKIVHLYETYETYESREHFIKDRLEKMGQNNSLSLLDRLKLKIYHFRKKRFF